MITPLKMASEALKLLMQILLPALVEAGAEARTSLEVL
jgi:hypothetical protein